MTDIRPAQKDDKGTIAELIYSSGTELYDFIFATPNKSALEFIQFEYLSGRGFCGYHNVTVAVENDTVLGTGCFYDGHQYDALVKGTLKNVFRFYGFFGAFKILARMRHTGSSMRVPRKDEVYLSNFGVSPESRGKGIGAKMIARQKDICREKRYKVLSLDVSDNNPRAESLYTRLGFQVMRVKEFSNKKADIPITKEMKFIF
ncbi:hypothetical protein A9Q99_24065 [Gammaproteobacteria bacterium 45_16_T64]|nr:hypothetical protein A9Q99_24065 [Gammaproteobacteria bacterium 45_16_T64]